MYSSYQYMKIFCRFGKILCILNGDVNLSDGKLSVLIVFMLYGSHDCTAQDGQGISFILGSLVLRLLWLWLTVSKVNGCRV